MSSGEHGELGSKPAPRTLKEQEYFSIKHALPKTRISHAILHENTSQDRHLNMKLSVISHRQNKTANIFDQNKRNFIETQIRKNKKWKSQDEMGAATMNFPTWRSDNSRRPSMAVLYQSPQYYEKEEEAIKQAGVIDGKLLPYMTLRRERTEILQHSGVTYTTKLPTVIVLEDKKLQRYDTYCGINRSAEFPGRGPSREERFMNMLTILSPQSSNTDINFNHADDPEDPDEYNSDDNPDDDYGHFGTHKPNRFRREKPTVVVPVFPKLHNNGDAIANASADTNANIDGRFNSPTLKKVFAVKSAKPK